MSASKLVLERQREIKDLVAAADLDNAIKRLLDFTTDFCGDKEEKEALLISDSFHVLEGKRRQNGIATDDYAIQRSAITSRLLDILSLATNNAKTENTNNNYSPIGDPTQLAALAEEIRQREVPNPALVEAKAITKKYPNSKFIFRLTELELRQGEITGLIGENATGKTTLCRIIAGDLKHDTGKLNYPLFGQSSTRLDWLSLNRQIAYVPQEIPKWQGTLLDNIRHEAVMHGIKGADNEKVVELIVHRLELKAYTNKRWSELSGGYKLRFALAKALVWKPKLLVLDEPLANLDVKTQVVVLNDLRNLVKSLRFPMSVIISSQQIHEIETVADRILFMREGTTESIDHKGGTGINRSCNTFELECPLSYQALTEVLSDFPVHKTWYNGISFFITTDLSINGFQLLQHLESKRVNIQYYRDISQSIKIKLYEAHI